MATSSLTNQIAADIFKSPRACPVHKGGPYGRSFMNKTVMTPAKTTIKICVRPLKATPKT